MESPRKHARKGQTGTPGGGGFGLEPGGNEEEVDENGPSCNPGTWENSHRQLPIQDK